VEAGHYLDGKAEQRPDSAPWCRERVSIISNFRARNVPSDVVAHIIEARRKGASYATIASTLNAEGCLPLRAARRGTPRLCALSRCCRDRVSGSRSGRIGQDLPTCTSRRLTPEMVIGYQTEPTLSQYPCESGHSASDIRISSGRSGQLLQDRDQLVASGNDLLDVRPVAHTRHGRVLRPCIQRLQV
jgi:hypothetical protein